MWCELDACLARFPPRLALTLALERIWASSPLAFDVCFVHPITITRGWRLRGVRWAVSTCVLPPPVRSLTVEWTDQSLRHG